MKIILLFCLGLFPVLFIGTVTRAYAAAERYNFANALVHAYETAPQRRPLHTLMAPGSWWRPIVISAPTCEAKDPAFCS